MRQSIYPDGVAFGPCALAARADKIIDPKSPNYVYPIAS